MLENTGKSIIENLNLQARIVVDPTLLVEREIYESLFKNRKVKDTYQLFSYILHKNQSMAHTITDYVFNRYFDIIEDRKYAQEPLEIYEWLYNIKNAKFVVTNSFHGVIFSIIFHTPFIVVPVENSTMNNRIVTLLEAVGLKERMVNTFNESKIDQLVVKNIDWYQVDEKVGILRKKSVQFLKKAIENT